MLLSTRQRFHFSPSEVAPRLRLFCFPYGGAGHSMFLDWPRLLPPDIQVCMAKLAGRAPRFTEAAFDDVNDIVADFIDAIDDLSDIPFVLLGHSVGALIAFELTRELARREAVSPECLIASGRSAPQIPYVGPLLHRIDEEALKQELRRIGGTPESFLTDTLAFQAYLPMLRADFSVTERYVYRPGARLSCPVHVFGGQADGLVPLNSIKKWQEQTCSAFSLRYFPGDHFFINTSRHAVVAAVESLLTDSIAYTGKRSVPIEK